MAVETPTPAQSATTIARGRFADSGKSGEEGSLLSTDIPKSFAELLLKINALVS